MDARLANFRNYRPLSTPAVLGHLADFGLEVRSRRLLFFLSFFCFRRLGSSCLWLWQTLAWRCAAGTCSVSAASVHRACGVLRAAALPTAFLSRGEDVRGAAAQCQGVFPPPPTPTPNPQPPTPPFVLTPTPHPTPPRRPPGMQEDISAHNAIRGLSGGQKVKLVLAGERRRPAC